MSQNSSIEILFQNDVQTNKRYFGLVAINMIGLSKQGGNENNKKKEIANLFPINNYFSLSRSLSRSLSLFDILFIINFMQTM